MNTKIKEIIPRILRDMNDGVLVLNMHGQILYLNDRGYAMLGVKEDITDRKYGKVFLSGDADETNDQFHQFVVDAVYDKEHAHSGEAVYKTENSKLRYFNLTSSFLYGEMKEEKIGIVVLFTDVTEVARLNRQRRESSIIFAVLMICVCIYLFLWSFLRYLNVEPPSWIMNLMIEGMSIVMFVIILKTTSFSLRDIGLKVKNGKTTFLMDGLIAFVGTVILVLGKFVILRTAPGFFPKDAPFWDWSVGTFADIIYPFTVILQEFLARGVMQENLNRIFIGKYAGTTSVVISALLFGVLHIAHGLPFMIGASVLLGALGVLYHKQGTIWGLCIVHYVLGETATFLRYLI